MPSAVSNFAIHTDYVERVFTVYSRAVPPLDWAVMLMGHVSRSYDAHYYGCRVRLEVSRHLPLGLSVWCKMVDVYPLVPRIPGCGVLGH